MSTLRFLLAFYFVPVWCLFIFGYICASIGCIVETCSLHSSIIFARCLSPTKELSHRPTLCYTLTVDPDSLGLPIPQALRSPPHARSWCAIDNSCAVMAMGKVEALQKPPSPIGHLGLLHPHSLLCLLSVHCKITNVEFQSFRHTDLSISFLF